MKQGTIVRNKMWYAVMKEKDAVFSTDFYTQIDILEGLSHFDLKNVNVNIKLDKTDKGFDAYFVSLKLNKL